MTIPGADADFYRRDPREAIESGEYPEWELGLQLFSEAQAEAFSFDLLDATKPIPEERVPVRPVERMVLNRNPDDFFAETEQVAFCTAHVVPGIDFNNDPLLAGRHHSHVDTPITRLGGQLSRAADQCVAGAGVERAARRHPSAGGAPRARGPRAELAGRRAPVPGRGEGFRFVPAPARWRC